MTPINGLEILFFAGLIFGLTPVVGRYLAGARNVSRIKVEIPENFPLVWGDPVLVERLLENVVLNALQYAPEGQIRVLAEDRTPWITVTISDAGPGISPEYTETVFQKFFRIPGTLPGGTGLGLSICKEIMDLHGGKIQITSNGPNGTRVNLNFKNDKPYRR